MGCGALNPQLSIQPSPEPHLKPVATKSQLASKSFQEPNALFEAKRYEEAVIFYQKYLETNFDQTIQIDGLGNYDQACGYYQWYPYEWYMEGIKSNKYKGTVLDALSLCYMKLRDSDEKLAEGIEWYKKMVDDYPESYQMLFGYANILNNQGYYDDAVQHYSRVIEMKPDFLPSYECIAFVYQFKRINVPKALQYANKCLEVNANSMVGRYIIAKNEKDPDLRIEKLKENAELFPKFSRGINMVGFVYGVTKKMPEQAIIWHKKSIEATPLFDIANHNIGNRYEEMNDLKQAIYWQIESVKNDRNYKLPMTKLQTYFTKLNWTDEQIDEELRKHKVLYDYFYYSLGVVYYDAQKLDVALKFYNKSLGMLDQLKKQQYRVYNSIANAYLKQKKHQDSINAFKKAIQLYPKFHMAYYNMANVYKQIGNVEQAKACHKKSIQINPRYSYPYNNLGNIYLDQKNYDQAIKCYKKAVKHRSNYVLAMANLGVCYLKIQNYREAFNAISMAKELMAIQANTKDLSAGNKVFLQNTISNFDKEGENWRMSGGITPQVRNKLQSLIKSFEKNFSKLYDKEGKQPVNVEKIMKKEVVEIVKLLKKDQFELKQIDPIYDLVKKAFWDNEEYFHFIPQIFMQYFYKKAFVQKKPILEIEKELFEITKKLSAKTSEIAKSNSKGARKNNLQNFKLNHFNPPKQCKVNAFKQSAFFKDYTLLYSEITKVNDEAITHLKEYKEMIDKVRIESKGIPYGVGLKIPKAEGDQFKVILRIFQKMFKQELNQQKVKSIISKVDKKLTQTQKVSKNPNVIETSEVVKTIMEVWTNQITDIVKTRWDKKIETKCQVSDFLRAKIMYETVQNLKKALTLVDEMCFKNGYKIIQMENRLEKEQTQDVVLKIQIKDTVCQLQLAMQQDETQYHFIHSIYEIERSPLGCIFASYIYMSKGFHYPMVQNCKDIVDTLKAPKTDDQKEILEAAQFVVKTLSGALV